MAKSPKIHDHEQALSAYLKDMLGEQAASAKPVKEASIAQSIVPVVDIDTPAPVVTETETVAPQQPVEPIKTEVEMTGDIRLLLFKTAGMELAIPVSDLNNIVRWPEKALTKIPGKAPWALGIYSNMGTHTEVIDILPVLQSQHRESNSPSSDSFNYIILVDNNQWGIACEQIREIINIPNKEVNWRTENDKRPWLKGLVNSRMSSIVDINALINALQSK